jgi:hypothetical protein
LIGLVSSSWLAVTLLTSGAVTAVAVDFSKEVFPVLQRSCLECHGRDKQEGGLRLDEVGAVAHTAEILWRIALPADDKEAMPRRGKRLSLGEQEKLRQWLAAGAAWPASLSTVKHWAYVKPVAPVVPKNGSDIDHFILTKLAEQQMKPAPAAEAAVLLRRLSFDTRGIPPTPAEVAEFERDRSGYPQWVERFLQSKDFGVKWARHWLDLARYADSHGYQRDDLRQIWAYRDWVVDALNADLPFDQFTIAQVAGDLLPQATPAQIIATGFHRCTPTNVEAGTEPEESRINQVIDRVNTSGAVWLGTTLECAQCHDHKYDPFSMKDYYGLLAFFNNTEMEADRTNPKVPGSIQFKGSPFTLPDAEAQDEAAELKAQIAALQKRIVQAEKQTTDPAKGQANGQSLPLKVTAFEAESGAEYVEKPDGSLLITGPVPDGDTYTLEASLPSGPITGLMVEALKDDSLPGDGPGRGNGNRPNFVLQDLSLTVGGKPLSFSMAQASFSQSTFPVEGLIDDDATTGWAINPRFGESHWTALTLEKPLSTDQTLHATLKQHFGAGRVIGRLRISAITGDVASALPQVEAQPTVNPQLAKLTRQQSTLQKRLTKLDAPTTEVMKELIEPRMTRMFKRGDWMQPTDRITAATPAVLPAAAKDQPGNRLGFAKWLVSEDNPLTARVTVNRWWAEIFGRGIVSTAEDFGIKGEPPSHPELLDYLATQLMAKRWSMKAVLTEIFLSATYQQSSTLPNPNVDPDNVYLARGPRYRLDAEGIRDNALAVAGLLNPKLGGPPIYPPQPDGLWTKVGGQNYKYEVSAGDEQYRRGLYVVLKRGSPNPSMVNFDSSARMACVVKRSRSNTPLQALTLLNDPVYVEAAQHMATRMQEEAPSAALDVRLQHGFRLALARAPTAQEQSILSSLFTEQKQTSNEEKAWQAVASALLNLDETITKP